MTPPRYLTPFERRALTPDEERAEVRRIFIPLTVGELVWEYVDKVRKYCADNKIEATKGLSRALQALHKSYDDEISRNLDRRHVGVVEQACDKFKQEFSYELTVMYCSIANDLNYQYAGKGGVSDEPVRVYALCALMLLHALRDLPGLVIPRKLRALDADEILEAYVAPYELDLTRNIEICRKVLARKMAEIDQMEVEPTKV